jgi:transposase
MCVESAPSTIRKSQSSTARGLAKKGLKAELLEQDTTRTSHWYFSDEMRFGLWGQVRRRWGLRGVKIVQPKQIVFAWRYLVLAVDVIHLDLKWTWSDRMKQACLKPIFEQWQLETVIWDGASSHRGQDIGTLPMNRIFLSPYSPELNPAERIFEEVRREIEGFVYPSLEAKQHRIDQFLRRLRADKQRFSSLISWDWINDIFNQLPDCFT